MALVTGEVRVTRRWLVLTTEGFELRRPP